MSKLAFDAVGKYIHPTSYRQIVEIESLNQLTSEEQGFCRKTKYRVQLLPKFTIKSEDRSKFLWRLTKLQESKGLEVDKLNTILSSSRKGVIPTENVLTQRKLIRHMKFSADEDDCFKKRINNHGYGQKMAILRDCEFIFQERRTADSLKKRAGRWFC